MRAHREITVLAVLLASPLLAVDYIVTRYDDPFPDGCDPGDCSLREATIDANIDPAADLILLSAGTYVVDRFGTDDVGAMGDLDLLESVEIRGVAATMTTILVEGLQEEGINGSSGDPTIEIVLRNLTLRDSDGTGIILGEGNHTIEGCVIRGHGFSGINSVGDGVAILFGALTVRDSTIRDNKSGGLVVNQGSAAVENSTFFSNGLQIDLVSAVEFDCHHCTIVGDLGGAVELKVLDSVATIQSSIVSGACQVLAGGSLTSQGGNLESPGHSCGFSTGDLEDVVSPGLGAIGDHGGPTDTLDLASDSPAINNVLERDCLPDDQRGVVRSKLFFLDCDSGAVERATVPPPTPIFHDGFLQGNPGAWSDSVGF